jgi:hypothetical protein
MEAVSGTPHPPKRSPYNRSRVANGKLLPATDGRSLCYRRFRDLYEDVAADLGGLDELSESQKQLIRRAALLSSECERQEALCARGDAKFSLADYALSTSLLCRVFNILGVNRVAKTLPSLHEYLAKPGKQHVEIDDEGDTS